MGGPPARGGDRWRGETLAALVFLDTDRAVSRSGGPQTQVPRRKAPVPRRASHPREARVLPAQRAGPNYSFVPAPAFPICAAGTGVDGPWKIPLNSSLNVARGCARKSIWLP